MISDKIKLIIWDLDETFWNGTLSEEGISPIDENIRIVKELTDRGIVNSICSKNEYKTTKLKLIELGVWDYFVFSKISWNPKGALVKSLISEMGLRDVNVLFIDDNKMNLNEVKAFCPSIHVYEPQDILSQLLALSSFQGKSDKSHSRLKQYKVLETKQEEKSNLELSNVDFLKNSEIEIFIDHNYTSNLDRIYELIERTNQLNYTKIRFDSDSDKLVFLNKMENYLYSSGVVFCRDKYGDYGPVGFYLMKTLPTGEKSLEHFVFSCRTMNMGIECFLYNYLGCPKIDIVQPISYGLDAYENIDWIRLISKRFDSTLERLTEKEEQKTVLLGPCHLLQLSNFIRNSYDFVHYQKGKNQIKFDCPGFFLNDSEEVNNSDLISDGVVWSKSEFNSFHNELKTADSIVLHLVDILSDYKLIRKGNLIFRENKILSKNKSVEKLTLSLNDKVQLLDRMLDKVLESKKTNCKVYLLDTVLNDKTTVSRIKYRLAFHIYSKQLNKNGIEIIEMNSLLDTSKYNDGSHLNRNGYFDLSRILNGELAPNHSSFDFGVIDNLVKGNHSVYFERKMEGFKRNSLSFIIPIKNRIKSFLS